jgi:DNA-binding NarL/FixJ family response regulator
MFIDLKEINYLLKLGISGFTQKNLEPEELLENIEKIHQNPKILCINGMNEVNKFINKSYNFSEREKELLRYCASELTYKEIADKMRISPKTVDKYREDLFKKLSVHSRVGLALYALQVGLFMF